MFTSDRFKNKVFEIKKENTQNLELMRANKGLSQNSKDLTRKACYRVIYVKDYKQTLNSQPNLKYMHLLNNHTTLKLSI